MSQPDPSSCPDMTGGPGGSAPAMQWACYAILAGLLLCALAAGRLRPWSADGHRPDPSRLCQVAQRINPNSANWAELARLPGIGPTLARRIVDYRQARRVESGPQATPLAVFTRPTDLMAVPGIGPKTVARLAGHLDLPAEAPARAH